MNRRKFFSFLPALAAPPAICKNMVAKKFWAGTTIPRSNPFTTAETGTFISTTEGYKYSYRFVNRNGDVLATSPDLKVWRKA